MLRLGHLAVLGVPAYKRMVRSKVGGTSPRSTPERFDFQGGKIGLDKFFVNSEDNEIGVDLVGGQVCRYDTAKGDEAELPTKSHQGLRPLIGS